jgi:hypothetical protein
LDLKTNSVQNSRIKAASGGEHPLSRQDPLADHILQALREKAKASIDRQTLLTQKF